jgi:hypothetical protein
MGYGSLRARYFGNQSSGKKLVFNIELLLGSKYVVALVRMRIHGAREKEEKLLAYILLISLFFHSFWWLLWVPTLSVFLRKGNYEALRKAEEKTGRTVGNLLNKLVRHYLEDLVAKDENGTLRSPLRRDYS